MKILIINHEFPPVGGGGSTASYHTAKTLEHMGNAVEIITSAFDGLSEGETRDGCRIIRINGFRKKFHSGSVSEIVFFMLNGILFLPGHVKKYKPDVVYAFFTVPAGALGLFLKKVYKIPYFVFLRGVDVPGFYGGRFSFLNRLFAFFIKYIWLKSDAIVANSESLKELAYKTFNRKPIYLMPNGVDTGIFYPGMGHDANHGQIRIIFAGRLNKQKGIEYILEAMQKILARSNGSPVLDIVGDGPEKRFLEKKAQQLGILKNVIFSGWLERNIIADKYRSADIFVSASFDEGMPNAILEAMACGLPIVASDIPAHRELIPHNKNGLLAPVRNSEGLADAVILLAGDAGLMRKFRDANIRRIKDYAWQESLQGLMELNKKVKV